MTHQEKNQPSKKVSTHMRNDEIWKPIIGYEDLYKISNFGNVMSLRYRKGKTPNLLAKKKHRCGYLEVELRKNGLSKTYKIHRLVAFAFIPNPNNLPEINHIDEIKNNNCVTNLEWCDRSYNINYGSCRKHLSDATSKKVIATNILTGETLIFNSTRIAQQYGFNHSGISEACNGKRKHHKGYTWRFGE